MTEVEQFIESGVLEIYVMGQATAAEMQEVERMAAQYEAVRNEIEAISVALESYAMANAVTPDPVVGPFLMAQIDYMERLKGGEMPTQPPLIDMEASLSLFEPWLNVPEIRLHEPKEEIEIRIISYTPEVSTAFVWLKEGTPPEIHTNELEQFLIVEGSCVIEIEHEQNHMRPGDVLIIPLHKSHTVKVTSEGYCKILLQRVAA